MQLDLDDIGGAKELAAYRLGAAKEDLESAQLSFEMGNIERQIIEHIMRYSERYRHVLP